MKTFVLGGARSGKSKFAEKLAMDSRLPVTYIATAQAFDREMEERIAVHRARRPAHWNTVDAPTSLPDVLRAEARKGHCILVDCVSMWVSNLLLNDPSHSPGDDIDSLLALLPSLEGDLIFVGIETNLGVIPMGELSRIYCDTAGLFHQQLAATCDRVYFTVAGLPLTLKG